jgi:hypothetical protein
VSGCSLVHNSECSWTLRLLTAGVHACWDTQADSRGHAGWSSREQGAPGTLDRQAPPTQSAYAGYVLFVCMSRIMLWLTIPSSSCPRCFFASLPHPTAGSHCLLVAVCANEMQVKSVHQAQREMGDCPVSHASLTCPMSRERSAHVQRFGRSQMANSQSQSDACRSFLPKGRVECISAQAMHIITVMYECICLHMAFMYVYAWYVFCTRGCLSVCTHDKYKPSASWSFCKSAPACSFQTVARALRHTCAAMGHPILGDATYRDTEARWPRMMLHAWSLQVPCKGANGSRGLLGFEEDACFVAENLLPDIQSPA